jgi:DNA replication protein DnaC
VSESSVYQRLRGHLAELRLSAAAEALPGELDQAAADGLSHTAFLERLLAVEVTATQARRQASLARFACLPAPWQLADFDFDASPRWTASSSPSWAPCGSPTTPPTCC